jgi:serine protease AprX
MSQAKIHPDLRDALATVAAEETIPIIVRFRRVAGEPRAVIAQTVMPDLVTTFSYRSIPAVAAESTPDRIIALAAQPEVERIWYDLPVHTMLDRSVPLIEAPRVWAQGRTGKGVKVAVLDTGCDLNHPDLKDRIRATQDFTGKGNVQDGNGHGTHVAGIIAGSGAASGGRYRGVAPDAELYIAKVLDDRGSGRMSMVIAGLEWAVDQGVAVVNMSLGSDGACDGTDALSEACDAAVAAGVAVIVAAGNAGPNPRTVGSPGCARQVITIGASTDDDTIATFSSRGPTLDGRVKPDLVFPGAKIIAPRAAGTALGRIVETQYVELSGTSMATPHAAGTAALVLESEPRLTPLQLKDRLMTTAIDLGLDPNTQGTGRGNAFAAWQAGQVSPPPPPPEWPATFCTTWRCEIPCRCASLSTAKTSTNPISTAVP